MEGTHISMSLHSKSFVHFHDILSEGDQHFLDSSERGLAELVALDSLKHLPDPLGRLSCKLRLLFYLELERSFFFEISVEQRYHFD